MDDAFVSSKLAAYPLEKRYKMLYTSLSMHIRALGYLGREDVGAFIPYEKMVHDMDSSIVTDESDPILYPETGYPVVNATECQLKSAIAMRNYLQKNTSIDFTNVHDDYQYLVKWSSFFRDQGGLYTPKSIKDPVMNSPLSLAVNGEALSYAVGKMINKTYPHLVDPTLMVIRDATRLNADGYAYGRGARGVMAIVRAAMILHDIGKGDETSEILENETPDVVLDAFCVETDPEIRNKETKMVDSTNSLPRRFGAIKMVKYYVDKEGKQYEYLTPDEAMVAFETDDKYPPQLFEALTKAYIRPDPAVKGSRGHFRNREIRDAALNPRGPPYLLSWLNEMFGPQYEGYEFYPKLRGTGLERMFAMPYSLENNTSLAAPKPELLEKIYDFIAGDVPDIETGLDRMMKIAEENGWTTDLGESTSTEVMTPYDRYQYVPEYDVPSMVSLHMDPPKG